MKRNLSFLLKSVFSAISIFVLFTGCPQTTGDGNSNGNGPHSFPSDYQAGTIVLKDGSFVKPADYTAFDTENPPVAVLIGTKNAQGKEFGIGLHTSETSLEWAREHTAGYYKNFTNIVGSANTMASGEGEPEALKATFSGDTDGSDNWNEICKADSGAVSNAKDNYPAFHWVNTYNTTYSAVLAGASPAWYIPSIAELCDVYKNKDAINASLTKINGLNSAAADSGLGISLYWSSSQYSYYNNVVFLVTFRDGDVGIKIKNHSPVRVCCLALF